MSGLLDVTVAIPAVAFVLLVLGEWLLPTVPRTRRYGAGDWMLNLVGFAFQGWAIPIGGYVIAVHVMGRLWPDGQGVLAVGFWGAFALNLVLVDLLYYWQHRAFHSVGWLWALHKSHHASPTLDVWASARNTLWINLLFVYMLVNPVLGFWVDSPQGFFIGASVTASLDLLRHSRVELERIVPPPVLRALAAVFVVPRAHHQHHDAEQVDVNFGANFIVWDRLFGTAAVNADYPSEYGVPDERSALSQLVYPLGGVR